MSRQTRRIDRRWPDTARTGRVDALAVRRMRSFRLGRAFILPVRVCWLLALWGVVLAAPVLPAREMMVPGSPLRFANDTLAFANQTVFIYSHGYAEERPLRPGDEQQHAAFTLRCFAMCRTVEQFRKFARFDPSLPPPDDARLASLVRRITRHAVWRAALPPECRVVIPGYADLRALSAARPLVVQRNIGNGWPVYVRPGNTRMFPFFLNGARQQFHTRRRLEDALGRNDLFIAYLTTFPSLSINHAIVVYGRRPATRAETAAGMVRYLVYDPNHPDQPRDLAYDTWRRMFSYQKDWDFVGGKVTVLQVYSYLGQ